MDSGQIIFLILAIVFSIFSIYQKSKKQQKPLPEKEKSFYDFPEQPDLFRTSDSGVTFEQYGIPNFPEFSNIYAKNTKKNLKKQKVETSNFHDEKSKNISQNIELDENITMLEDFEGTEIQKAFLFSEIFRNIKN